MWGKLPFLAVLIGIFGVYSGNAFGDWYCGDNTYLTGNNQCQSCPSGYTSLSIDEPSDETDCWISDGSGGRTYYDPDANSGGSGGSSGGNTGGNTGGGGTGDGDVKSCDSGWWWNGSFCQQCPTGFNKSTPNASKRKDCYFESDGTKKFYDTVYCDPGKYLAAGGTSCTTCPASYGVGYWCPGGTYVLYQTYDQGKYRCPADYDQSDGDRSTLHSCYSSGLVWDSRYNCGSGKWYTGKTSPGSCVACPNNYNKSEKNKSIRPEDCKNSSNAHYSKNCPAGKYLPKNKKSGDGCTTCPNDRVCPGGYFTSFIPYEDQGIFKCPIGYKKSGNTCVVDENNPQTPPTPPEPDDPEEPDGNDPTPPNGDPNNGNLDTHGCKSGPSWAGQGQYYSGGSCKNCPAGFKNTELNATSQDKCYVVWAGGIMLYYKRVSCLQGKYLPAGHGWNGQTNGCTACPDDGKSYCPGGGSYWPKQRENQGIKECPSGQVPNPNKTACQNPNSGGNGGGDNIGSEFTCTAGFYLPAYGGGCQECTITTKYCPGGKYKVGTTDRGIFDCPTGGVATSDWKSCDIKLSKIKMKFGPNGTSTKLTDQCWLKTNIRDYAKCIFENSGSNNPYIHDNYKNEYEIETYNPNAPADS